MPYSNQCLFPNPSPPTRLSPEKSQFKRYAIDIALHTDRDYGVFYDPVTEESTLTKQNRTTNLNEGNQSLIQNAYGETESPMKSAHDKSGRTESSFRSVHSKSYLLKKTKL